MIDLISKLKFQFRPGKIYVDGAKPDFIKSLKSMFNEAQDYDRIMKQATHDKVDYQYRMFVVPVSFNEYGRELLRRFQHYVSKGWFSVSQVEHKDLVTQMRMATYQDNGNLDKSETGDNTFDSFDATRCALMPFHTAGRRR